jgi:hypothetical protein
MKKETKFLYAVVAAYDFSVLRRGDVISRHKTYESALKAARKSSMLKIEEI